MSILIQNGTILLPKGPQAGLSLAIEGADIARIAPDIDPAGFDTVIDAADQLVMPGLVNAHTHLAMVLLRGFADDMPLQPWLEQKIWPAEAQLTAQHVHWGALWGCVELIRGGVTAFADMYFFMDEVARAVEQAGVRALLTYGMIAPEPGPKVESELCHGLDFAARWQGGAGGRIRTALAPHAPYTSCDALWARTREAALEDGYWINTHISETRKEVDACVKKTGMTPVAYLESLGVFEAPTLAAHCVHVGPQDIETLARRGVCVSHNPGSNLKLGSGIAPLPELLEAGVTVALGTDGVASNNNLNLFEELQLAALLHKGTHEDAVAVPAAQAVTLATRNGYRALGFAQGGELTPGAPADVVLVDLTGAHLEPVYQPLSALVYSAQAADVHTTIVAGQILMRDRVLTTLDEEQIRQNVNEIAKTYRRSFHAA